MKQPPAPAGELSPRERLDTVFDLRQPDRTPVLGGWIAWPKHIMAIARVDADTYWADPQAVSIDAYRRLGTDGLISIFVPANRKGFRNVNAETYAHADTGQSLEDAVAEIDAMDGAEQIAAGFDLEKAFDGSRSSLAEHQQRCGEMVWMPATWGAAAAISWYSKFGYQNFFTIIGLYPNRARKLVEIGGANGLSYARVIAREIEQGLRPRVLLLGEDICTQRGPMLSPKFMRDEWLPHLKRGLAPIIEAGGRPVWHCDGDVRLMLDMLIEAGVKGLQGFQPECGLTIDDAARLRTRDGEPMIIFGPLSVTTELPVCSPEEIRRKVRHAIKVCRDNGAGLCLFTANTINPDVPLENLYAMYEAAREG